MRRRYLAGSQPSDPRSDRAHFPVSVIGKTEHSNEEALSRRASLPTLDPAAHTSPHRLSAVSGEGMNPLAEAENRKFQIANWRSKIQGRKSPTANREFPFAQWQEQ